ncbi:unnamed protein product, partial [Iphiclides podalirius]
MSRAKEKYESACLRTHFSYLQPRRDLPDPSRPFSRGLGPAQKGGVGLVVLHRRGVANRGQRLRRYVPRFLCPTHPAPPTPPLPPHAPPSPLPTPAQPNPWAALEPSRPVIYSLDAQRNRQ